MDWASLLLVLSVIVLAASVFRLLVRRSKTQPSQRQHRDGAARSTAPGSPMPAPASPAPAPMAKSAAPNWNAVGAITGVLGLIVSIIGLFKG